MEQATARALILETADAWTWAVTAQSSSPLVLIPTYDGFDPGLAAASDSKVIVPVGPGQSAVGPRAYCSRSYSSRASDEDPCRSWLIDGISEAAGRQIGREAVGYSSASLWICPSSAVGSRGAVTRSDRATANGGLGTRSRERCARCRGPLNGSQEGRRRVPCARRRPGETCQRCAGSVRAEVLEVVFSWRGMVLPCAHHHALSARGVLQDGPRGPERR